MVEYPLAHTLKGARQFPYVAKDWEILKVFLDKHSIEVTWIDCDFTWGWLDEESGKWTGGVGKVWLSYLTKLINVSFRLRVGRQTWLSLTLHAQSLGWLFLIARL